LITELDRGLATAEVGIYLTTAGMPERADQLEAKALAAGLISRARRAKLLKSDALSRRGELERSLGIQLAVLADAERDGDRLICARAQCLVASTYDRLADIPKSQAAAQAGVQMLEPADPASWHAEHMMVLALFTCHRRRGAVDFTTFDEAVRLACDAGDPLLLLAVLNNYAYVALEASDPRGIRLAGEMQMLIDDELGSAVPSPWLDTIAVALLAAARLDEAARAIEAAISRAPEDMLEPDSLPACVLTAAAIERARGNDEAARERLLQARSLARELGAPEPAAMALKELSDLAAKQRDFEAAYTLLRRHLDEWSRYQTERSERHAATIQAIYGAEVERRRRVAIEQLADSDPLTGLWNRRYLDRRLAELAHRPISLALLDLDDFKQVNDRVSHDAGDTVLRHVADLLRLHAEGAAHGGAFAARLGGDEFVLVFPGNDGDRAQRQCDRVRTHVHATDWARIAADVPLTVSIGLVIDVHGALDASALLSGADASLYEAKRQGRNRVVTCGRRARAA